MELSDSKRLLQIAVAIGGIVPVGAGAIGIVFGPAFVDSSAAHAMTMQSPLPARASNLRFARIAGF